MKMKKIAALIPPVVLLLIILTGCKTSSFNNQKYTHYKVSKENKRLNVNTPREERAGRTAATTKAESVKIIETGQGNHEHSITGNPAETLPALMPPVKEKTVKNNRKITASASPVVLVQKTFKSLNLQSKKQSNKGPLEWLIDTVFGIIILALIVVAIAVVIIVVLL
jgi:hypothetical protein